MLSRNLILSFAVLCSKISHSLPSVGIPIDAQFPPVAVVGQTFSFTFSPATFTSALDISYSAKDLPVWLRFEASRRIFIGTPAQNDVGNSSFELEATDSEGSTAAHLTLVVLAKSSITADQDLFAKQLSSSGAYSAPNALLLSPETFFNLEIGPSVFESDGDGIAFYATSENHAPLPAWIRFDEVAVKFSGTTPSLLTQQSSPQTFSFSLLASQVPQFSQSTLNFQLSVTNHILAFANPTQYFNVSAGSTVSIPPLIEQLHLDAKPVPRDQIAKISSNQPDWLLLRSSDLSFYGTAPDGIGNTTFRLEVDDEFNNVANIDIRLLAPTLDNMHAQDVYLGVENVTAGQNFNYTFADLASRSIEVEADLGLADSWLHFEPTNVSVQGIVPSNLGNIILNISAIVRQNGLIVEVEHLTLSTSEVSDSANNEGSGNETAVSRPTSTPTESSSAEAHDNSGRPLLALVITVPIVIFLLVCFIIACLIRRCRRRRARTTPFHPPVREISQSPTSGSIVVFAEDGLHTETANDYRPPSLAPQVSIRWGQNLPQTRRAGSVENIRTTTTTPDRSSWDAMLMGVDNLRGESIDDRHQYYDTGSATISNAKTVQDSSPTTPVPLLISRKTMPQTPIHADPGSTSDMDGRKAGSSGHDIRVPLTNLDLRQSTLRSVPLSPLLESSPVASSMFGRSFASRNWALPKTVEASSTFGGEKNTQRRPSLSSGDSGYENLEEDQTNRTFGHLRKRTASTPFSGSLWEDDEWMTEDSISRTGNWQSQGLARSESRVPTELSFEDSIIEQWNNGPPHCLGTAMSNVTSMGSQRSQQSQTNSLRFI